jgi:general secretion pathway protein K
VKAAAHGRRQRGVALMITLFATALLTVLVIEFTYHSQVEYRRAASWVAARQASLLADSGVLIAAHLLDFDALADSLNKPAVDHLGEIWAQISPPMDTGYGTLALRIEDDSGRYNLNRLRTAGASERERAGRLFEAVGVDPALIGPLVDWLDRNSTVLPFPQGAENDAYAGLPRPYPVRNGPLRTFNELALVRGFRPADLIHLRRVATVVIGEDQRINVNTAPPEVLRSLHPSMNDEFLIGRILELRATRPFTSLADLRAVEGLGDIPLAPLVTMRSQDFRVLSTGGAGGTYQSVESLLHRVDAGIQVQYRVARRGPNIPASDTSVTGDLSDLDVFSSRARIGR